MSPPTMVESPGGGGVGLGFSEVARLGFFGMEESEWVDCSGCG